MTPKKSPEIEALEAVYGALKELAPETRMKVLNSVFALLGIEKGREEEHILAKQGGSTGDQPSGSVSGSSPASQLKEVSPVSVGGRQKSLMELVLEKEPHTNIERIVLFAYYREKYENKSRFERNDLEPYFAKARVVPPKNYSRDFNEAVKKGWIHEDGSESYITSRGIETVESRFASEKSVKPTKAKARVSEKKASGNGRKKGKKSRPSSR